MVFQDSVAAAAGRGAAQEAASSRDAATAGRSESSSIGLGAYIGCFNANSRWLKGAENATKVRSGAVSRLQVCVCVRHQTLAQVL